jgi:hypothetical protein
MFKKAEFDYKILYNSIIKWIRDKLYKVRHQLILMLEINAVLLQSRLN